MTRQATTRDREVEHPFGWVVVAAGALAMVFTWGATAAPGILLTPLVEELGWSHSTFSGAMSLLMGLGFALSGPWGWLVDRWSARGTGAIGAGLMGAGLFLSANVSQPWHLYLTLGLLAGVGLGSMAPSSMAPPARWFSRHRSLAMGLVTAGTATGYVVMPQIAEALVTAGDWRFAFRGLGILTWATMAVSLAFFREPGWYRSREPSKPRMDGPGPEAMRDSTAPAALRPMTVPRDKTLAEATRTLPYWVIGFLYILAVANIQMAVLHLAPSGRELGLSGQAAATLVTILGIFSVIAKVSSGYLGDRLGPHRIIAIALSLQAVALLGMASGASLVVFYIGVAIMGFTLGAWVPLIPSVTAMAFGSRHIGAIYGSLMLVSAVGSMGGPLMGGWLFDLTGAYAWAFGAAAAAAALGAALAAFLWVLLRRMLSERAPAPAAPSARPQY